MTSRESANGCYVYIMLPGQLDFITAGRVELNIDRHGRPLGRFVFGRRYLERADAVDIDPIELGLGKGVFETTHHNGIFGALRDSGPDYWGRHLIERHQGGRLDELDYLLHSPEDRAGALGFGLDVNPPVPIRKFNQTIDLAKLQALAEAIIKDDILPEEAAKTQVEELMLMGTSMGGARPKTVVEDEGGLWLAKFNQPDDKWNYARVEHAMLVLARNCGIVSATSRVVTVAGRDVLLVKRFDREKTERGYLRARMVSALTLLRADEHFESRDKWSYVLLVEELRRISSEPRKDAWELFRRMTFNALISNIDDHPRNHAVIATERGWELSPAYDLGPTNLVSLERRDLAMACGDHGRWANAGNLQSQCARFLLSTGEAENIVNEMESYVKRTWHEVARAEGVSEQDCELIKGAFSYPGFRLPRHD